VAQLEGGRLNKEKMRKAKDEMAQNLFCFFVFFRFLSFRLSVTVNPS
jgi:hypothetical protein